jgi:seryl-tRNA synthetase
LDAASSALVGAAREPALKLTLASRSPRSSVPRGADEHGNVVARSWGTARVFDFAIKDHVDVGAPLGLSLLGPAGSDRSLVRLAQQVVAG